MPVDIRLGIAWLNRHAGPAWRETIDRDTLDLGDGDRCVLGQLGAAGALGRPPRPIDDDETWYERVCRRLRFAPDGEAVAVLAFNADEGRVTGRALTRAWRAELARERTRAEARDG